MDARGSDGVSQAQFLLPIEVELEVAAARAREYDQLQVAPAHACAHAPLVSYAHASQVLYGHVSVRTHVTRGTDTCPSFVCNHNSCRTHAQLQYRTHTQPKYSTRIYTHIAHLLSVLRTRVRMCVRGTACRGTVPRTLVLISRAFLRRHGLIPRMGLTPDSDRPACSWALATRTATARLVNATPHRVSRRLQRLGNKGSGTCVSLRVCAVMRVPPRR
eukprot:2579835-Rhodomonas_salina.1